MPHSSRRDRETQEEPFTRGRSSSPPRRRNRPSRKVNEHRHQRSPSPRTHVFTSLSPEQVQTVSTVAERIKAYGPSFEQMVREKEAGNAKFAFLDSESQSNEAHYFRALLDDRYVPALPEQPFCDEVSRGRYGVMGRDLLVLTPIILALPGLRLPLRKRQWGRLRDRPSEEATQDRHSRSSSTQTIGKHAA